VQDDLRCVNGSSAGCERIGALTVCQTFAFDNAGQAVKKQKSCSMNKIADSIHVKHEVLRATQTVKSQGAILIGSLFSRQPAPLLGIDISSSSIKLVELGRDKAGGLILERCALEILESGWVTDGNVEKFDNVVDALRRLVKKSGSRTKNVALALPSSAVITRRISLPGDMTEQEMEIQVESEAGQYIPFSLDEVILDFCIVGPNKNVEGDVDVLIAASRKERIEDHEGLAEAVGLKAVIMDVESHASRLAAGRLIEMLPGGGEDVVVALFEVGAMTTSMQVLRGDEILYEREQAFGGAQLTQTIARQYGFSKEEAESKKRSDDLPVDYSSSVLAPFVESAAQEVVRTLQFFFSSTPYSRVDHILLAGGSVALPGLAETVAQHTGAICRVANPFDDMEISSAVRFRKMEREAPTYLTACGLAMRRFMQ